jgi:hypothetical protein
LFDMPCTTPTEKSQRRKDAGVVGVAGSMGQPFRVSQRPIIDTPIGNSDPYPPREIA